MKRIRVVITGGTIGSKKDETGVIRVDKDLDYSEYFPEDQSEPVEILVTSPCFVLSENMDFPIWETIMDSVEKILAEEEAQFKEKLVPGNRTDENRTAEKREFAGILILHGSDTLSYTTALFGHLYERRLAALGARMVLTGANKPLSEPSSNGRENLKLAWKYLLEDPSDRESSFERNSLLTFVRKRVPPKNPSDFRRWLQVKDLQQHRKAEIDAETENGLERYSKIHKGNVRIPMRVCAAFDGMLMDADRIMEADSYTDRFSEKPLVIPEEEWAAERERRLGEEQEAGVPFVRRFLHRAQLLKAYPGFDYSLINLESPARPKAFVHVLYHSGTGSEKLTEFLRKCRERGIQSFCVSVKRQVLSERYETTDGMMDSAVFLTDMTPEWAFATVLCRLNAPGGVEKTV